jgi:hypothetical protein
MADRRRELQSRVRGHGGHRVGLRRGLRASGRREGTPGTANAPTSGGAHLDGDDVSPLARRQQQTTNPTTIVDDGATHLATFNDSAPPQRERQLNEPDDVVDDGATHLATFNDSAPPQRERQLNEPDGVVDDGATHLGDVERLDAAAARAAAQRNRRRRRRRRDPPCDVERLDPRATPPDGLPLGRRRSESGSSTKPTTTSTTARPTLGTLNDSAPPQRERQLNETDDVVDDGATCLGR